MKNVVLIWLNDHAQILIASFIGGWIQVYFARKKKKVKFSFLDLVMNIIIAMFVGWGVSEISILMGKAEWATVAAMLASISSNSILNSYLNNEKSIWLQILRLKFNIKLDNKEKD